MFPGNCFDFAGQHGGVTAAFATKLEGFSKCVQHLILVVDGPRLTDPNSVISIFYLLPAPQVSCLE